MPAGYAYDAGVTRDAGETFKMTRQFFIYYLFFFFFEIYFFFSRALPSKDGGSNNLEFLFKIQRQDEGEEKKTRGKKANELDASITRLPDARCLIVLGDSQNRTGKKFLAMWLKKKKKRDCAIIYRSKSKNKNFFLFFFLYLKRA